MSGEGGRLASFVEAYAAIARSMACMPTIGHLRPPSPSGPQWCVWLSIDASSVTPSSTCTIPIIPAAV